MTELGQQCNLGTQEWNLKRCLYHQNGVLGNNGGTLHDKFTYDEFFKWWYNKRMTAGGATRRFKCGYFFRLAGYSMV